MSTNATKLDRALRLQDVLINVGAIPLPVDLIPITLPQPADAGEAIDEPQAASLPSDETAASAVMHAVNEPATTEPAHDTLLAGLQAAREAIHDSLRPDLPVQAPDLPVHAEPAADVVLHETVELTVLPQEAATPAAAVLPVMVPDAQAVASPSGSAPSSIWPVVAGEPTSTTSGATSTIESARTVESEIHPSPNAVEPSEKALESPVNDAATTLVHEVTIASGAIEHGLTTALPVVTQTVPQVLPAVTQVLEAVTVPSLHGAGLDALAGLLQPPAVSTTAHGPVDGALSMLDHALMFAPIGLEDFHHPTDAGLGHVLHAALPLAGSGLI